MPIYVGPPIIPPKTVLIGSPYDSGTAYHTIAGSGTLAAPAARHGWYFGKRFSQAYQVSHRAGLVPKKSTIAKIASFVGGATIGFASGGVTSSPWKNLGFNLITAGIGRGMSELSGAPGWFGVGLGLGAGASLLFGPAQTLARLRDAAEDLVEGLPYSVWDPAGTRYGGMPDPFHSSLHGDLGSFGRTSGW